MRIPREIVDRVRERIDISEVIGRHVRLERRGNSLVGLCPFHQERSPSFNVVPHKAMYHCFGCGNGGDVFKFLMLVEGLSFVEAVKELALAANIEIPERDLTPDERRALAQRASLYDVLEAAAQFYESTLWTRPEGQRGREYLDKRAMPEGLRKKARMGFAPAGRAPATDALRSKGISERQLLEVGLLRASNSGGGTYEMFRERVLFPIRDERARVIGFGGRLLEGDGPKYVNTPETRLYEKSKVLYGLEMARNAIQQRDRVIVVEGYFDVLAMHDAGFSETVATCGTALTPDHLEKLRRLTTNVIVLLDADEAGSRAAEKVLPMLLAAKITPWRLQLPGAKDPDELVRTEGVEAMKKAIERKEPLLDWVIGRRIDRAGAHAMSRERVLNELAPMLKGLPQALASAVAAQLHLSEQQVFDAIKHATAPPTSPGQAPEIEVVPMSAPAWRPTRDITHLVWLLVHRYGAVADLATRIDPALLDGHEPVRAAVARLIVGEPVASIASEERHPDVVRLLHAVVAKEGLYAESDAAIAMCEVIERLEAPAVEQRLQLLMRSQEEALRAQNMEAQRQAGTERMALLAHRKAVTAAVRKGDVAAWIALRPRESG